MIWFVFEMGNFSEAIHLSLMESFMRASQQEGADGASRLYSASSGQEKHPATYYLRTADEGAFAQMVRQFGGHRCSPPALPALQEIPREAKRKRSAA